MGGMIATEKKHVEKRVPILGAIPWLGRLFRSSHEVNEKRKIIITITARTVNGTN
jgi:type IV pilus assembly protein PilQ